MEKQKVGGRVGRGGEGGMEGGRKLYALLPDKCSTAIKSNVKC
jgi:hypothetical protein